MAAKISVLDREITVQTRDEGDYISLAHIAKWKYRNPDGSDDLIRNWIRNRNTFAYLGV